MLVILIISIGTETVFLEVIALSWDALIRYVRPEACCCTLLPSAGEASELDDMVMTL